jgi:hypothetical protein
LSQTCWSGATWQGPQLRSRVTNTLLKPMSSIVRPEVNV